MSSRPSPASVFESVEAPFRFRTGTRALLISIPHAGTCVPPALAARFTRQARELPDTDWHLERLYEFADELGVSLLVATHSRYVIDLNRPPDDRSLYPGKDTTALCPIDTFDKTPVYADAGDLPREHEIIARRAAIWHPYHRQLQSELRRLKAAHGAAGLWDAHSIRSVLPRFFKGRLPDLNLGTGSGGSCDPALAQSLFAIAGQAAGHTAVLDGRFTGGYITRHYGQPGQGIHAVQLELTQRSYMQEARPFDYLPERAAVIQPTLRRMIEALLAFVEGRGRRTMPIL